MNILQLIWQKLAPNSLLSMVRLIMEPKDYKIRRKAALVHFKKFDTNKLPHEIREGLRYLKFHKFSPYPFKWTRKYDNLLPDVFYDKDNNSHYILFENKRMYFPKSYGITQVIWSVRTILKEQDPHSPHLYLTDRFQVEPESIIIDAGVAEGNFALSVVEKAKLLFLVECENEWMQALRLTFAPWKDKVVYVEKFMSDTESETTTSIDGLLTGVEGEHYFIKLDIEGYEKKALSGMEKLIGSGKPVKIDVCTYHNQEDPGLILQKLQSMGFKCQVSNGYILYFQPGEEPSFRKALVRAEKE
jgi:hypothetical protein